MKLIALGKTFNAQTCEKRGTWYHKSKVLAALLFIQKWTNLPLVRLAD